MCFFCFLLRASSKVVQNMWDDEKGTTCCLEDFQASLLNARRVWQDRHPTAKIYVVRSGMAPKARSRPPLPLGPKHCQYGGKFLPQAAETLPNEGSPAVAPAQRKSPPLKKEEPAQASSAVESAASSSSVKEAPAEISVKEEPAQAPIGLGLPPEPSWVSHMWW